MVTFVFLCFLLSAILTTYYAYIVTASTPTDPLVIKQRFFDKHSMHFDISTANNGKPIDLYCNICKVYVQERTKHCGPCNRCCSEFDHHCNWLNNCIGSENYREFRILINWFFTFITLSLVLFVAVWACGLL